MLERAGPLESQQEPVPATVLTVHWGAGVALEVRDRLGVPEGVPVVLAVREGEKEPVGEREGVGRGVEVMEAVPVGDTVGVPVPLPVEPRDQEGVAEELGVAVEVAVK
jgi:hypothetical protein